MHDIYVCVCVCVCISMPCYFSVIVLCVDAAALIIVHSTVADPPHTAASLPAAGCAKIWPQDPDQEAHVVPRGGTYRAFLDSLVYRLSVCYIQYHCSSPCQHFAAPQLVSWLILNEISFHEHHDRAHRECDTN